MATERQLKANRRNARKSTGPRSKLGKKRTSQNAYRHGLALRMSGKQFEQQLEQTAREIAGESNDIVTLHLARVVAEAHLELVRVRRVKLALIESMAALGSFERPKFFRSIRDTICWLIAMDKWDGETACERPPRPKPINPPATLPSQEPERSAEALRRILPDLVKLQRYESRAVSRRDQAIGAISLRGQQ